LLEKLVRMTLSDETLLRYADGLLDEASARLVEAALALDDVAAERLRLIRLSGAALRDEAKVALTPIDAGLVRRVVSVGDEAVTERRQPDAQPVVKGSRPRFWVALQAAAAGLMMLVGVGGGFWLGGRSTQASAHPVWVVRVADYHTLYGRKTVDVPGVAAADLPGLEDQFGRVLGKPVTIPLYDAAMEFRRGQVLEFEREPILQLAYLPQDGMPMALCLKRTSEADAPAVFERLNGIGMVRWRRDGIDYVLVADQPESRLKGYAAAAAAQISSARRM
jgi:anti-sigma factor RsiW